MQARAARLARAPPRGTLNLQRHLPDGRRWVRCRWRPTRPATDFRTTTRFRAGQPRWRLIPQTRRGNTVYIGGAQGGVWKSTNAATSIANNVTWTPVTDDQATLSVGSIAIQPGNSNPAQSVILVGTGEADNSADSYFGLGILRSADGGNTWTLISRR